MKIKKLNHIQITSAKAYARTNKYTDKLFYNIILGSEGEGFFPYFISLAYKHFKPNNISDVLELTDDNYVIKTVKEYYKLVDGKKIPYTDKEQKPIKTLKDGKKYFTIYKTNGYSFPKDTLLIWEIPNIKYTNVTYSLSGDVELIEEGGGIGKERNGVKYVSPCLLLEIYGDCELKWNAINRNNEKIQQIITYKYNSDEYSISDITIINKE